MALIPQELLSDTNVRDEAGGEGVWFSLKKAKKKEKVSSFRRDRGGENGRRATLLFFVHNMTH